MARRSHANLGTCGPRLRDQWQHWHMSVRMVPQAHTHKTLRLGTQWLTTVRFGRHSFFWHVRTGLLRRTRWSPRLMGQIVPSGTAVVLSTLTAAVAAPVLC